VANVRITFSLYLGIGAILGQFKVLLTTNHQVTGNVSKGLKELTGMMWKNKLHAVTKKCT
jgi:hypothetical protein